MFSKSTADVATGLNPTAGQPVSAASSAGGTLSEEQRQRAIAARRATAAFGQIMALIMRSPQHQRVTVQDLLNVVAPLVMSGQYALAGRRFQHGRFARPVAAVLWARVSATVDERLAANTTGPLSIQRDDISSGSIIWIVDMLGDGAMIQSMIKRLGETQWKGQLIRLRTIDENKSVSVRTVGPI